MNENPTAITEKAKNIVLNLLPAKSREQYQQEYILFSEWKAKNHLHEKVCI
jgi:hypothetical protein